MRDGGGFALVRDIGGRIALDLSRMPVDLVEKRVRVQGAIGADGRVEAEGVAPA